MGKGGMRWVEDEDDLYMGGTFNCTALHGVSWKACIIRFYCWGHRLALLIDYFSPRSKLGVSIKVVG